MTPQAWIFMLVSIGFVVVLLGWCFFKVLTTPPDADLTKPPDALGG